MAKILGFSHGDDILVWSADDAIRLRKDWRVVGGLIGALPQRTRQNAHLGLPLKLMPEEATLLMDKGVLEIREYAPPPDSQEWGETFDRLREQSFARQYADYQQKASEKLRKFTGSQVKSETFVSEQTRVEKEVELDQKEDKRYEGMDVCGPRKETELSTTSNDSCDTNPTGKFELRNMSSSSDATEALHRGTVPTYPLQSCSFSPLVCIHVEDPMAAVCSTHFRPAAWSYPRTELEVVRYKVFADLWSRNYYITPGLKYGGDYLVYTGDPALVHSHYVAIVQPWTQPVSPLVSCGRIGTKVKKNTLLCSVDSSGAVRYFTWQWTGLA